MGLVNETHNDTNRVSGLYSHWAGFYVEGSGTCDFRGGWLGFGLILTIFQYDNVYVWKAYLHRQCITDNIKKYTLFILANKELNKDIIWIKVKLTVKSTE